MDEVQSLVPHAQFLGFSDVPFMTGQVSNAKLRHWLADSSQKR